MATLASTTAPSDPLPIMPVASRLLTVADLAAMPEQLPSGTVSYELHHGRLVPMSPPVARHGELQALFGFELVAQGQKKTWVRPIPKSAYSSPVVPTTCSVPMLRL
jgi:Uma2 family endonuclease